MNSLMISVKPKWCELIASGKKTIEVRKTKPRCDVPFRCYIYCTNDRKIMLERSNYDKSIYLNSNIYYPYKVDRSLNGKIIGEFICDKIERFDVPYPAFQKELDERITKESCLSYYELHRYAYHDSLYGWHITELVIYDEPKKLSEFYKKCNGHCFSGCPYYRGKDEDCDKPVFTRPPQSWCYVEVEE